jgi:hypothetical protein
MSRVLDMREALSKSLRQHPGNYRAVIDTFFNVLDAMNFHEDDEEFIVTGSIGVSADLSTDADSYLIHKLEEFHR